MTRIAHSLLAHNNIFHHHNLLTICLIDIENENKNKMSNYEWK